MIGGVNLVGGVSLEGGVSVVDGVSVLGGVSRGQRGQPNGQSQRSGRGRLGE